jgi:hypothetical protein
MRLKSLAVITLLVLGCSAAFGQSFSFGFLSYTGGLQYCDFEVFTVAAPFAAGTHNLTTGCGFPVDGVTVGFKNNISRLTGIPVTGAIVELADNVFDAEFEAFTGCQIDWETKTTAMAAINPKFGWEYLFTCGGGGEYLGNFGFLTTHLGPVAQQAGTPTSSFHGGQNNKANLKNR